MRMAKLIFSSFVPASPGDASLSFFGIVFDDATLRESVYNRQRSAGTR